MSAAGVRSSRSPRVGYHTVGLKSDNSVVAVGSTFQGQRTGLEDWIDMHPGRRRRVL